jgi:hypothetical protein
MVEMMIITMKKVLNMEMIWKASPKAEVYAC